jgi:NADH-quinone oxidoreductase subunit N
MTAIENARQTLLILLPELLILLSATAMMTLGAFVRLPRRTWAAASAATMVVALLALILLREQVTDPYGSVALNDAMSVYSRLFFLLTGLLILAMAHDQVDDGRAPEFFGSLLMINAGAMLVAASNELVFLFIGLELVSMPTYLLLYLSRRNASTQEAATKYFFLSIFSSGLLLFGLAYLYGMAGVSNLKALAYLSQVSMTMPGVPHPILGVIAVVFVTAGLGFRVAAVPFHFYAPDVYEGSPTIVAALLAWVPKGIGFVAILRTLTAVIPGEATSSVSNLTNQAAVLSWIIAVVTMTLGNTVALAQTNLKRLFAYSSIAHAGYLMIGVAVAFRNGDIANHGRLDSVPIELGSEAILFYLVTYALMTLGAFAVIIGLSTPERPVETLDDLAGLVRTHPVMALAMAICLFSLAGIPPLAGFIGKFNLFVAAFEASNDSDARMYQALGLIGVLNAAIGAYYYLKIVVAMYYRDPIGPPLKPHLTWPTAMAIGACSTLTLLLGLWTQPIYSATRASAVALTLHPRPIAIVVEESTEHSRSTAEEELRRANEEAKSSTRGLQWIPPASPKPAMP